MSVSGSPTKADPAATGPAKKTRWATRRVTGKAAKSKRESILSRIQHPIDAKRRSTSPDDLKAADTTPQRRVWFNQPLPPDALDEAGTVVVLVAHHQFREIGVSLIEDERVIDTCGINVK